VLQRNLEDLPKAYSKKRNTELNSTSLNFPEGGVDFNSVVDDFENKIILQALQKTGWNKNQAAILLKLNRTTLIEKIKKKGLKKPIKADDLLDLSDSL